MSITPTIAPVQIPLANDLNGSFQINIEIPGSGDIPSNTLTVQLDTGSTGLVLPASFFYQDGKYTYDKVSNKITSGKIMPNVTIGGPATVKYQPSQDDIHGFHFTIPVLLVGVQNGTATATTTQITAIGAVEKTPHMCGIGFGRPVLASNPFLSIEGMSSGAMYASFLLTTKGIWLGLTPEQAAAQLGSSVFGFQKLTYEGTATPQPLNSSQWTTPTGYFRVSTINPTDTTQYGVLMDTGVDLAMVKSPIADFNSKVVAGSVVAIEVPVEPSSVKVSYSFGITGSEKVSLGQGPETFVFTTEDVSGAVPPKYLVPRGEGHFVNTGFHLLNSYQFYFDAQVGQAGYAAYPV